MNKLKKWVVLKLVPDYFDAKENNKKLRQEINTLIFKPNSIDANVIINSYTISKDMHDVIWSSDSTPNKFEGFFKLNNEQQV